MDTASHNRLRFFTASRGGSSESTAFTSSLRAESDSNAASNTSTRRRQRSSSAYNPDNSSDDNFQSGQAQAATTSTSFRPLVSTSSQGVSNWNAREEDLMNTLSYENPPPARRLHRARSNSRRNRRLFATPPSSRNQRRQEANLMAAPFSDELARRQESVSGSSQRLSLAFESSPRLELPEHSLHSFKRSFEDATINSANGTEDNFTALPSGNETSPSGSSAVFSSSSPSPNSPSTRSERQLTGINSTSAYHEGSLNLPLPESWLRNVEQLQDVGTSTSTLSHSPPTPDNAGSRIKRRRSRSNRFRIDGPDSLQRHYSGRTALNHAITLSAPIEDARQTDPSNTAQVEQQEATPASSPREPLLDDWLHNDARTEMDFNDMSLDTVESTVDDALYEDGTSIRMSPETEENPEPQQLSFSNNEEAEVTPSLPALESPSTSISVSVRRGLQRQFSLGTLPLFHFEEEDDRLDAESSGTQDQDQGHLETSAGLGESSGIPSPISLRSRSRLPRAPRRPYLQRNTTAVSPPEESPQNTPEERSEQLGAFSAYPGLRQWQSTADQASSTSRTASGEFVQSRPTEPHTLTYRFGDQAPRLSLNLDLEDDIMQHDVPIASTDTARRLNILEPAENGRTRSTSAATSSSSSSLGTGWHSEGERARAELLSDHLEASRRIAADVQRLQSRLGANTAFVRPSHPTTPHSREAYPPLEALGAGSTSIVPPRVSLSSALGSTSRRANEARYSARGSSTSLWGEVVASSPQLSVSPATDMATTSASTVTQPSFTRRPGALGGSNMRGPTRSSNEAWMRAQGIDFYDSLQQAGRSTRTSRTATSTSAAPPSSANTSRIPTSVTAPTLPSFRRTTPTPVSSLPSSPSLPSISTFAATGILPRPAPRPSTDRDWSLSQSGTRRTLSEHVAQGTLPLPANWGRSSARTLSAGHPGANQSADPASRIFTSSTTTTSSTARQTPGPQLEAIRPLSPLFQPQTHAPTSRSRRRQNTAASDFSDDEGSGGPVHPLSTSVSNSRAPMSWLQDRQATDARRAAARESLLQQIRPTDHHDLNNNEVSESVPAIQPINSPADSSRVRTTWREELQAIDARRTAAGEARIRSNRSSGNSTAITDWFRGHTNEMPPERPSAFNFAISARVAAATETEEASDGIAAAVRRLDDVRRLLDEVEQNMQRRRQSYEARATEQNQASHTSSRHILRDISTMDTRRQSTARSPDRSASLLSTRLPSIRASPVTSVSRGSAPGLSSTSRSSAAPHISMPLRSRSQQRSDGTRPTLQPFEEIFAEVEAEFSQRDRTRSATERLPGTRSFVHGLSRDRRREAEEGAIPYEHRERQATPELSTSSLETIQSELTRLRRRLQRDWSPQRSGFALQDSNNTRLSDIASLRARDSASPDPDFDIPDFDVSGSASRREVAGERVPLPPFLLRSLRARRQATFGHRENENDIAAELGNYAGDLDLDMSYEGLLALSERLGEVKRRGATSEALSRGLVLFNFVKSTLDVTGLEGERETRCAICLEDYEEQDKCAKSTKCGHALHEDCLTTWLRRNDTCPICRQTAV